MEDLLKDIRDLLQGLNIICERSYQYMVQANDKNAKTHRRIIEIQLEDIKEPEDA